MRKDKRNSYQNKNKNINNLLHRIKYGNNLHLPCEYTKDLIKHHIDCLKKSHAYGDFIISDYKIPEWYNIDVNDLRYNWNGDQKHRKWYKHVNFEILASETRYDRNVLDFSMHQNLLVKKNDKDYDYSNLTPYDRDFFEKDFESWVKNSIPHDKKFFFSNISPIKFSINLGFFLSGFIILFGLYVFSLHSLFSSLFFAAILIAIIIYEMLFFIKTLA
jgi:hypothetical protein